MSQNGTDEITTAARSAAHEMWAEMHATPPGWFRENYPATAFLVDLMVGQPGFIEEHRETDIAPADVARVSREATQ